MGLIDGLLGSSGQGGGGLLGGLFGSGGLLGSVGGLVGGILGAKSGAGASSNLSSRSSDTFEAASAPGGFRPLESWNAKGGGGGKLGVATGEG